MSPASPSEDEFQAALAQLEKDTGMEMLRFMGSTDHDLEEDEDSEDEDQEEEQPNKRQKKDEPPAKSARELLLQRCHLFLPEEAKKLATGHADAMCTVQNESEFGDTHTNNCILDEAIEPAAKKAATALRKKDYIKALGHGMGTVICVLAEDGHFFRDQELYCDEKAWKKLLKDMKYVLNGLLKASDADLGFDKGAAPGGLARKALKDRIKTAAQCIGDAIEVCGESDDMSTFKLTALK